MLWDTGKVAEKRRQNEIEKELSPSDRFVLAMLGLMALAALGLVSVMLL